MDLSADAMRVCYRCTYCVFGGRDRRRRMREFGLNEKGVSFECFLFCSFVALPRARRLGIVGYKIARRC